jgi:pyruvate formate lyase activating enzyme
LGLDKCRLCLDLCPGLKARENNLPSLDASSCGECFERISGGALRCANVCPAKALIVYGRSIEANEALDLVKRDSVFQNRSGGGLTVTGGEPLYQGEFLLELLSLAERERISTVIETSGFGPYELLKEAAGKLKALFYDLKIINPSTHIDYTGVDNRIILDNLIRVYSDYPSLPITVRTPVVPGVNFDLNAAQEIGYFLRQIPKVSFEALAYHAFGGQKYHYLGRQYQMGKTGLTDEDLIEFRLTVNRAREH